MKKCSRCLEVKLLDDFYRNWKGKYGRGNYCKPCIKVYNREPQNKIANREACARYYQANKAQRQAYLKKWYQDNKKRKGL